MAGLLYLKNSFDLSDEELVARWAENVYWQHFCGLVYFEPRLPCDATQIGRFRRAIGEDGMEWLLKATIETGVQSKAIKPQELERVIVDSTVQEKAIAHPTDSRLLEIARHKAVLRRQRTVLGIVMREVRRKLAARVAPTGDSAAADGLALAAMNTWLERAQRIHAQKPKDKNKLYALHAPEVECIGKGKARKPYEFGVKVGVEIIYRGKFKSLTRLQRQWLRRRQAVEPAIGHAKADHRMDRCWLKGSMGDALHALSCALGYNIRWLTISMPMINGPTARAAHSLAQPLRRVQVPLKPHEHPPHLVRPAEFCEGIGDRVAVLQLQQR
jgi:hypothetical protein